MAMAAVTMVTASTEQLKKLMDIYKGLFPLWTFPYIPFIIAASFQVLAWVGGSTILSGLSLIPRIAVLWLFAGMEYLFMSPAINAGVEVLGQSESFLVVIYHVVTLVCFILINTFIFGRPFEFKYLVCFILLAVATYIAHMW